MATGEALTKLTEAPFVSSVSGKSKGHRKPRLWNCHTERRALSVSCSGGPRPVRESDQPPHPLLGQALTVILRRGLVESSAARDRLALESLVSIIGVPVRKSAELCGELMAGILVTFCSDSLKCLHQGPIDRDCLSETDSGVTVH